MRPEWLGAIGSSVAASFGVVAFIWQVVGARRARQQTRRAQARRVWFLQGDTPTTVSTEAGMQRLIVEPVTVFNDSDEVIAYVHLTMVPVQWIEEGKGNPVLYTPNEDHRTSQVIPMIGPGSSWTTARAATDAPLTPEGEYEWVIGLEFQDAAGVNWLRLGQSQDLTETRRTGYGRHEVSPTPAGPGEPPIRPWAVARRVLHRHR